MPPSRSPGSSRRGSLRRRCGSGCRRPRRARRGFWKSAAPRADTSFRSPPLWPEARFLGVDLSPVQIAAGNARIERLGLANIVLSARSLDEIGASDGVFDFIVCHGVYSWIPAALRETLAANYRRTACPRRRGVGQLQRAAGLAAVSDRPRQPAPARAPAERSRRARRAGARTPRPALGREQQPLHLWPILARRRAAHRGGRRRLYRA